jgi:DNA-binding beta-propeller fold protein YncE
MSSMGSTPPTRRITTINAALLAAGLFLVASIAAAQSLVLTQRIELPSVQGRLDHMDIDVDSGRLFVAALGANSIEVVDLRANKRIDRFERLHEPQGVVYLPDARRLFVANGAGGGVEAFADGKAPAVARAGDLDDVDNLRFDPGSGHLFVGYAHALAVLDPRTLQVIGRVELSGHPEAFQLESSGPQIYVNVPSARHIAVVDWTSGKVTKTWDVAGASRNFPMALDEQNHRLFVATRQPALLLAYDTTTGKRMAELPICGDSDDLFFDGSRRQLYAVCGEGFVQVIRQRDPDHYVISERVATSPGARTGLFVPRLSTLFVAVPAVGTASAEIRGYSVK